MSIFIKLRSKELMQKKSTVSPLVYSQVETTTFNADPESCQLTVQGLANVSSVLFKTFILPEKASAWW